MPSLSLATPPAGSKYSSAFSTFCCFDDAPGYMTVSNVLFLCKRKFYAICHPRALRDPPVFLVLWVAVSWYPFPGASASNLPCRRGVVSGVTEAWALTSFYICLSYWGVALPENKN